MKEPRKNAACGEKERDRRKKVIRSGGHVETSRPERERRSLEDDER